MAKYSDDYPEGKLPPGDPRGEPVTATAGEQSHEDPDEFRGGEADAPRDPDAPFDDIDGEPGGDD
jgi:hypothetical protein